MRDAPLTEYAAVGDTDVAYQVFGEGSVDVLYFYGLGSHVDLVWDLPSYRIVTAFVPFSRVIQFDRRGTGASGGDRERPPVWEEWIDDVRAVLAAAKSERVTIVAEADAGPIAMLFAAAHPEQVSALVLANTSPPYLVDDDYPIGLAPETLNAFVAIDCLTHRHGETYEDYIDRVARNDVARRVKIADLDENLANNRRLPSGRETEKRIERYERPLDRLGRPR